MRIDIMTLFPDAIEAMMGQSIIGRARDRGYIRLYTHQIREYTTNKQMQVDDYPYGGGRGAVMQADPLYRCWEHICREVGRRPHTIYLSPCGRTFTQEVAKELKAAHENIVLVCGHYEGVDQRFIDECVDEELSMGDPGHGCGGLPVPHGGGGAARGELLHRREPLERPFGVSPVFPAGGVARAQGARHPPQRQPWRRG